MDKVFKSKIDIKPTIIRLVIFLLFVPALLVIFKMWDTNVVVGAAILEFIILNSLLLHSKTTYTVTNDGILIINIRVRKIKINIGDINSISRERSWSKFMETTHVNSLDQLKLIYKKYAEISLTPQDKEEFIKELQNHNPKIMLK
ncbi:MAG: PH domain-containing protein [Ferruginibacter sp.]